ncbi:glycogen debranching protein GlgX [Roseomonas marmotae]|uniref:Glycogen debranching protein GlgX n=1 Tax=Roseomonas marmotae TaxID=2768161 RepID=A0ABS3K8U6_9PROT|nr:glycogen debranching protein GlgX [Roseomonas marmotae]MBO1073886.1 glycogen debranching protein GlgX [Roseomonas marmotae]QTI78493.1 glycogen debranching protein GlgX [Roseomonas marmotae]
MPLLADRLLPGRPDPLGATWDGLGVNFALFSAHAEKVELCVFDAAGRKEVARLELPECTDEVFHGYLPEVRPGLIYGYRAYGPYRPEHGHRFNPNKLLLDPYARQLQGSLRWTDALNGYRAHTGRTDLSFDRRDSAAAMPKAIVTDDAFNWGDDRPPAVPWDRTLIYETHLRGLTVLRDDLAPRERGTFAALADPRVIEHLQKLGVTAVELLPVQAFLQDRFLVEKGLRNYWGYSPLSYFAPEPRYLSQGSTDEIRVAIRRLHAAGLEVILDVVYNHTCEADEMGPTLSWRGIDNASYYRLRPGDERRYIDETGCGNTVNLSHPRVLQMVMDSLRYWATSFRVDGFRFDLGTTLGREGTGFDPGSGFFDAIRQDPVLSRLKLITEPWDIGPGGYQLGNHPPGFSEWNDRFRDDIRRFWRGDAGARPDLAARLAGSSELFDRRRRRPWASINFVSSHDGFTLQDLVSFTEKNNLRNGEHNRDGHDEDFSANWGVEGPTRDIVILAQRERIKRAMLMTLLVSHGTPMLLGGDEFGRTQQGNNNAYCQDNDISWFDWSMAASEDGIELSQFFARAAALRRAHPTLRSARFLHGQDMPLPGVADLAWFDEHGAAMRPEVWGDAEGRVLAMRRAAAVEGGVEVTLLLVNGSPEARLFTLPRPALPGGTHWRMVLDSAEPKAQARVVQRATERVERQSARLLVAFVGQEDADPA